MATDAKKETKETLKTVEIDSQVVLKVIQHCTEAFPQLVTGSLLGLDVGLTLEVTDCFPFPVRVCACLDEIYLCPAPVVDYDACCLHCRPAVQMRMRMTWLRFTSWR